MFGHIIMFWVKNNKKFPYDFDKSWRWLTMMATLGMLGSDILDRTIGGQRDWDTRVCLVIRFINDYYDLGKG